MLGFVLRLLFGSGEPNRYTPGRRNVDGRTLVRRGHGGVGGGGGGGFGGFGGGWFGGGGASGSW